MRTGKQILTVCLLLVAGPAAADKLDPAISPASVIAVVTADWNRDGGFDRAVLVEGAEGEADLYIYLSAGPGEPRRLVAARPGLIWRGTAWGTVPELRQTEADSFEIVAMNEGIGRSRWHEILTITYLGGGFVVAGYSFDSYDTLDPELNRNCEADYLTGRGTLDRAPFTVATPAAPLAEWEPALVPPECAAG